MDMNRDDAYLSEPPQCKENAGLLGVDPERIILSGSSAGANLVSLNRTERSFMSPAANPF